MKQSLKKPLKIKISTMGCRLNEYEIQSIITELVQCGHEITEDSNADIEIINTCVVTQKSEAKSRNLISRSERSGIPQKKTIVAGCFAKKLKKEGGTVFLPNDYKNLIPQIIANWDLIDQIETLESSRFKYLPPVDATTTRVNLKIQDGCARFCSYCIIPLVRGKPVSKSREEALKELKTLIESGYKEIILTGISIGQYESENTKLSDLLELFLDQPGEFRIHLSSLDPDMVDEKLLGLLPHPKLVKHLHLSLQSGSNLVLKAMNRRYTREQYLAITEKIRLADPGFNLTTDLIVGFPGETDQCHADTIDLINRAGFSHIHTFRFSPRPLTTAAKFKQTVSESLKKKRSFEIMEITERLKADYFQKINGKHLIFLGETISSKKTFGHCNYYLPIDVYEKLERNRFYNIKAKYDPKENKLTGELFL